MGQTSEKTVHATLRDLKEAGKLKAVDMCSSCHRWQDPVSNCTCDACDFIRLRDHQLAVANEQLADANKSIDSWAKSWEKNFPWAVEGYSEWLGDNMEVVARRIAELEGKAINSHCKLEFVNSPKGRMWQVFEAGRHQGKGFIRIVADGFIEESMVNQPHPPPEPEGYSAEFIQKIVAMIASEPAYPTPWPEEKKAEYKNQDPQLLVQVAVEITKRSILVKLSQMLVEEMSE